MLPDCVGNEERGRRFGSSWDSGQFLSELNFVYFFIVFEVGLSIIKIIIIIIWICKIYGTEFCTSIFSKLLRLFKERVFEILDLQLYFWNNKQGMQKEPVAQLEGTIQEKKKEAQGMQVLWAQTMIFTMIIAASHPSGVLPSDLHISYGLWPIFLYFFKRHCYVNKILERSI